MALRPITDFASQILKPYINNQDKAYAANIAPVETSPATSAHTAGTQIIYNGVLYDVTADINANDALATTGAGANIAAADDVSEQISNVKNALKELTEAVKCLVLSTGSTTVNALPYTFTNANIENDMVCINSVLSNPSAQTGDWTVTTSSGTAQITGTISGATTITLYLMKSR